MTDPEKPPNPAARGMLVGMFAGIGVGALLSLALDKPALIAIGLGLGMSAGWAIGMTRQPRA